MQRQLRAVVIGLACPILMSAQDPLVAVSYGWSLRHDSSGAAFSFSFNRTASEDAGTGGYLKVWGKPASGRSFALKPSAEVNVGPGVDASANNVIGGLDFEVTVFHPKSGSPVQHMWITAPLGLTYASDKDFKTHVAYLSTGTKLLAYRSMGPKSWHGHVIPGLAFDLGRRQLSGASDRTFTRVVPSLDLEWRRGRVTVGAVSKAFVLRNDVTVVENGTYGLVTASLKLKLNDHYAIAVSHTNGFEEPLFERQNSAKVGLSFYQ